MKNDDNYEETRIAVGNYIRKYAPRGANETALKRAFESTPRAGIEFERGAGKAICSLYVEFSYQGLSGEMEEYLVQAKVNWPSFGESSPALAITRIELMREVGLFAAEIESAFSKPVFKARSINPK